MIKIRRLIALRVILSVTSLLISTIGSAQIMTKQCRDKRCVSSGGGSQCSTDLECDPGKLTFEVISETPSRAFAHSTELDFGQVLPGLRVQKRVKITNVGRAPLTITLPFIQVGDSFLLGEAPTANFSLNTNESRTFWIFFQSMARGAQFGALSILTNDQSLPEGRFNIWLKGQTFNRDVGAFWPDGSPWGNVTSITEAEVQRLYGASWSGNRLAIGGDIVGYCYWQAPGSTSRGGTAELISYFDSRICACAEGSIMRRIDTTYVGPNGRANFSINYCVKTTVSVGVGGDQTPVVNDLLLIVNDKVIPRKVPFEIDIGSYVPKKTPEILTFWLKNNSAQPQVIDRLLTGAGLRVDSATLKKTLAPGEMSSFKLSLDTATPGVKSSSLTLYRASEAQPYYALKLGGIVWTETLEALEQTATASSSPSPAPTVAASKEWGADVVRLLNLKTKIDFERVSATLPNSVAESVLKAELNRTEQNKIFASYLAASKRALLSVGAKESAAAAQLEIEKQNANDAVARLSVILHTLKNDQSGLVRYELLSMLSTLKYLHGPLRIYTQIVLSDGLIDKMVETNALGRFYLRAGYLRTYLATSPPLNESTPLIESVLNRMRDPIQKGIIMDRWLAQYPELYAVPGGRP